MEPQSESMRDVLITGWAHTAFGRLSSETLESLIVRAGRDAITASGLAPEEIDEIFVGTFNSGLVPLAFPSSLALQIAPELRLRPATRVENACASGSAAVHAGIRSVLAGTGRHVLVIGAEKMTHGSPELVGTALMGADYDHAGDASSAGFASLFAEVAVAYEDRFGPVMDTLGDIAAKNHANGMRNPYAHLRKPLTAEFCRTVSAENPIVASPLRRTDCSPVSDGAAALVLSSEGVSSALHDAVRVSGFGHASDFHPAERRDPLEFAGSAAAWHRALRMADTDLRGLDFVELHDCFTIAELVMYEVIGLAPRGRGADLLADGTVTRSGPLPINVSGGLKSKGHPIGATGVSQHVMAAMQLSGSAGEMQLDSPRRAAVHNMGGLAVANYVTVLEATV